MSRINWKLVSIPYHTAAIGRTDYQNSYKAEMKHGQMTMKFKIEKIDDGAWTVEWDGYGGHHIRYLNGEDACKARAEKAWTAAINRYEVTEYLNG